MNREIKIKITTDGKVEIDSSVFKDCKEAAEHLTKVLGKIEIFSEKSEMDMEERIKIETEK